MEANTTTWQLGPYTVRIGLRPDNPAFPVYLVFRGDHLIGKNFSRPSRTDCEWLERTNGEVYAKQSRWPEISEGHPIWNAPKRRGRPRKEAAERELQEALAS